MNPLQVLYSFGLSFDRKLKKQKRLLHPVLSVGNISVGGRAKTPLVIDICKNLKERGYQPVVLTRGYARKISLDYWLLPEALEVLQRASADKSGDEALEIFLKARVPVLVSSNRALQAKKYAHRFANPKIIFVLDDGFQHWSIKRDFDLVVVSDADFKDGLLPTGRLRESTEALKRADCVLHLDKDLKKNVSILKHEHIEKDKVTALTTRAGSQKAYLDSLTKVLGFEVPLLKLKDHLASDALLAELYALDGSVKQLLVGVKEAVKIFGPQQVLESATQAPIALHLKQRSFDVFIVELSLDYDREAFFKLLQQKGLLK
ncbi:MAG: tetraacyldisaccharide 4'-kinase [Bdellovibrionota bacterium]